MTDTSWSDDQQQWDDETIERTVDTLKGYTGTGAYLKAAEVKQLMRDVRDDLTAERDALRAELVQLSGELHMQNSNVESLKIALNKERTTDWRQQYNELNKLHVEDVRQRKEVRRFRLENFSIGEIEAELKRRTGQEP
jgi:LPS O-antigen subunit length determinant protein (WzzB/FepE family)